MLLRRIFNFGRQLLPSNVLQNSLASIRNKYVYPVAQLEILKTPTVDKTKCEDVIENVNKKLDQQAEGRLFAVVHLCGKQFKVTAGDLLQVEGYWPPSIGDRIRLDKVLVAGGEDFSLIGRPLVQPGLVDVQATIIEKSLSHTKIVFRKKPKKQYENRRFQRHNTTMLRINSITVAGRVDQNLRRLPRNQIYQ